MATIHKTTLVPAKLELLAAWLPAQEWYRNPGEPSLARAGGFRLDDPAGAVGIEFMVVLDEDASGGGSATAYLVPMTYRASALPGAGDALIGTSEHGVLGPRWIYDGTRDQVLLGALAAFVAGRLQAQAQSVSDTPDPTVLRTPVAGGPGAPGERLDFRFERVLTPAAGGPPEPGQVTAPWTAPAGASVRSVFVTAVPLPA